MANISNIIPFPDTASFTNASPGGNYIDYGLVDIGAGFKYNNSAYYSGWQDWNYKPSGIFPLYNNEAAYVYSSSKGEAFITYAKNVKKYRQMNSYYYARMCVWSSSNSSVDMYWGDASNETQNILSNKNVYANKWTMVSGVKRNYASTGNISGMRVDINTKNTLAVFDGMILIDVTNYMNNFTGTEDEKLRKCQAYFDTHLTWGKTTCVLDTSNDSISLGTKQYEIIDNANLTSAVNSLNASKDGESVINLPVENTPIGRATFAGLVTAINTKRLRNGSDARRLSYNPEMFSDENKIVQRQTLIRLSDFDDVLFDIKNIKSQSKETKNIYYDRCLCDGNMCDCQDVCEGNESCWFNCVEDDCVIECWCEDESCEVYGQCGCETIRCSCDGVDICDCVEECYCDGVSCTGLGCIADDRRYGCGCNSVCSCNWV